VACPAALSHRLKAYAYDRGLGAGDRLFPIGRKRTWQVIFAAAAHAGLGKRIYPHLFRHSGAIERLRQTGNPRALQLHLGHVSPLMTMRYLSTLTAGEALRINQGSGSRTKASRPSPPGTRPPPPGPPPYPRPRWLSWFFVLPWQTAHYVPYRQLPWEIIDELTLRHLGYITYVVSYEGYGHHKATLFFGLPVQNYFYKAMDQAGAYHSN